MQKLRSNFHFFQSKLSQWLNSYIVKTRHALIKPLRNRSPDFQRIVHISQRLQTLSEIRPVRQKKEKNNVAENAFHKSNFIMLLVTAIVTHSSIGPDTQNWYRATLFPGVSISSTCRISFNS